MRVSLLGPLRLDTDDGRPVPVGGVRLRMLLARLALDPGRFVPVDTLVDDLWGATPPADAANALQSLVSRLRKALPVPDAVVSGPAGYRLAVAPDDVDVTRFDRLTADGRAHLRAGHPTQAAATLAEALRLVRGDALADLADAPFAAPVTARLTETALSAAEDRFEAELALGHQADVVAALDELTTRHPLRERLVTLRIRALADTGRTADALAGYQRVRQALADELGVDPSAELEAAHLAVLRGQDSTPKVRNTLPAPLTSFVGRDAELADATALLRGNRLVSLLGAGGAGKTRLAVELACRWPGRVWFVELASVREDVGLPDLVAAVLSALDLRDVRAFDPQPTMLRDPLERVVDLFGSAPGLLVLDNCEHVVNGAAELADVLLRRCPALTVLATTREPLAITGEVLCRVGPLDLPEERAPLADALTAPAVRLFADRAVAAQPTFTVDEQNLAPVTEICRRLDGMPLALELAAARLRAMTPHQVADLLDDRFRLLTGGSRTSLPRHRTLRGVVEWSWELLTKPERMLAMRLATLAGGATEESAVGVCADADLSAADIPYLLASLVEKSLLTVTPTTGGRPRYRMLETVRAYGLAELAAAGEADRISTAYVDYFVAFIERVEPTLRTAEQLTTMAQLRLEHDNVSAALARAVDMRDVDKAARLVGGMGWYWAMTGNGTEAFTWVTTVAELPPPERETAATVGVRMLGLVARYEGLAPVAEFDRLWAEGERLGLVDRYPMVGVMEAVVRIRQGTPDRAREAAERLKRHPDPWARAAGRLVSCFIAVHMADVMLAEDELLASLAGFQELGERWGITFTLGLLGQYRMMRGDQDGAVRAHEEAVRIAGELGTGELPPMQLMQLGAARGMAGDVDGAERDVLTALSTVDGNNELRLMGLCVLIHIAVIRKELAEARRLADEAVAVAESIPDDGGPNPRTALQMAKASISLAAGDLREARMLLATALDTAWPRSDMSSVAGIGERIAVLVSRRGEDQRAAELLGAAAGIRGMLDQGEPNVRELVGMLRERIGEDGYRSAFDRGFGYERETAIEHLRAAVT
ncbi:MAG TPA: BTAD domain-containing putative transcriptional regulator [Pseudonocardiaceae bacterium]|nr:BTAD domain-containing putative transcriptional regulator [Pseudonocardiaceae bacterium]